ncbi:hypothetical protein KY334_02005 [Candidatus Woesearchaeota archaeon]|nr:hypothetical protein [Candidatus Woesearchaeota archaeon]
MKKILDLFELRDEAVSSKNKDLFLSTQYEFKEIKSSPSKDYMELSELNSEVLHVVLDENTYIVMVAETRYKDSKSSQEYLLYYIKESDGSLYIYNLK